MNTSRILLRAAVAAALALAPVTAAFAQATAPAPAAAKPAAAKPATAQRTFASPDEAAAALFEAVKANNVDRLLAVVGPQSKSWLFTGDKVADANDWGKFAAAYEKKHVIRKESDAKAVLDVGDDAWPFPAPIVMKGKTWAFDADAGRDEITNRRVGRNELDTIQTLLAVVDAQREYAAKDLDGNGYADYAKRFRSTPGKKDGLYWPDESGKAPSPLGALFAAATKEGYGKQPPSDKPAAYHGYYFKLLTSQGKDAPGGAYDYMVGDKLLGGFGVVAYPANYRASGVVTFVVNHDGVVFEKDLGPQTSSMASAMTRFNPDKTWRKAE
jgi:hypothetical protein